jgi:hypothetical protein
MTNQGLRIHLYLYLEDHGDQFEWSHIMGSLTSLNCERESLPWGEHDSLPEQSVAIRISGYGGVDIIHSSHLETIACTRAKDADCYADLDVSSADRGREAPGLICATMLLVTFWEPLANGKHDEQRCRQEKKESVVPSCLLHSWGRCLCPQSEC